VDLKSTGMVRASDLKGNEISPRMGADITLALAIRFILEPMVGDTGLWNLLVRRRDGRVVNIDYEEVRSSYVDEDHPMPDVAVAKGDEKKAAKTKTALVLELGLLMCSSRGFGEDRAQAFSAVFTDASGYFAQQWQALVTAARAHPNVVSATRITHLQHLFEQLSSK
jgi:hypothetical protein